MDPKPIFKDQVGSGPCAHTKFSSATRGKVSRGQKSPEKLTFSKVELLQEGILYCTQFPSLGFFINKNVGFQKTKVT